MVKFFYFIICFQENNEDFNNILILDQQDLKEGNFKYLKEKLMQKFEEKS